MKHNFQGVNDWYVSERLRLVKMFGGCCRYCGKPDIGISDVVWAKKLEFCHKVNERVSGNNRGRNSRIIEVKKNPKRFWLPTELLKIK